MTSPPNLRDTILVPEALGGNRVIERISLLQEPIPHTDRQLRLPHAHALGMVIRNLVMQHAPLYSLQA